MNNKWVLDGEKIKKILKERGLRYKALTVNGRIKITAISPILNEVINTTLDNTKTIADILGLKIHNIIKLKKVNK